MRFGVEIAFDEPRPPLALSPARLGVAVSREVGHDLPALFPQIEMDRAGLARLVARLGQARPQDRIDERALADVRSPDHRDSRLAVTLQELAADHPRQLRD